MIKKISIIGLMVLTMVCASHVIAIDSKDDGRQNVNKIEDRAVRFYQGEIMQIDFQLLKKDLNLTKKQMKKISAKYNGYLKKQLKIKEKIVGRKVALSRLMMRRFYDDYEFDDIINDIFSKKKKLYKNSVFFIKELEDRLKKEQIVMFRQLVPELYNPEL